MHPVAIGLRRSVSKHLPRLGFRRKLFVLLTGTGIGQLFSLLAIPFIARLYSPADYGTLGIYMSLLGLMVPVAALRFECGVPAAESDRVAARLMMVAVVAATSTGVVLTICLFAFAHYVAMIQTIHPLLPYAWLIPLGISLTAIYQSLTFWFIRKQDFKVIAGTKVAQGVGLVSSQLLLGLGHAGPLGLLVGHMLGQSTGITSLVRRMLSRDRLSFAHTQAGELVRIARQYGRFPKLSVGALLLETASIQVPMLLFAAMYGVTVMGWVSLVVNVISAPFNVLAVNFGQVYFAELAELKISDPARMRPEFLRRLRQFAGFGIVITVPLAVLGSLLIPTLFGRVWSNSVLCLQLWIPVLLVGFVASPFGWVLDALQRQDLHLIRGAVRIVLPGMAIGSAYFLKIGWIATLAMVSAAISLSYVLYIWLSWIAVRQFSLSPERFDEVVSTQIVEARDASFPAAL